MNKTKMLCFLGDLSKLLKEYEVWIDCSRYGEVEMTDENGNGAVLFIGSRVFDGDNIQKELDNHKEIEWTGSVDD